MSLDTIRNDTDWQNAFGEEDSYGGISPRYYDTDTVPAVSLSDWSVHLSDLDQVIAQRDGEADSESWLGIFKTKDGWFIFVVADCDYTGWDCQAGSSIYRSSSLMTLLRNAVPPEEQRALQLERETS